MVRKALGAVLAAALLLAGCASDGDKDRFGSKWGAKEKGTAAGAAGGAATGAVISGATGGNVLGGAVLGGVAGGIAGYFFGDRVFKDDTAVAQPSGGTGGTSGAAASNDCQQANDYFRQAVEASDLARKEELYGRGLQLCPTNAYAHNDLGTVYLRQGKPDQARAEYRRALELKPDLEETRRNLELLG
jgi:tetratricopeptide (TPR) repeat protein